MSHQIQIGNQKFFNEHFTKLNGIETSFYIQAFGVNAEHTYHPLHRHSFMEVCYIVSGTAVYTENEIEYPLSANTMFITRPGLWHRISSDKGIVVFWAGFELIESQSTKSGIEIFEKLKRSGKMMLKNCQDLQPALLWIMMYRHSVKKSHFPKDYFYGLLYTLIISLCSTFTDDHEKQVIDEGKSLRRTSSILLYQARQFIKDNLSQDIQLETMSNYLHVSSRHLSRIFTNDLGLSYTRYVREEKIKKAIALLTATDFSIKQISAEIGCETVQYFTKIFTKETGVSPGKYRASEKRADTI